MRGGVDFHDDSNDMRGGGTSVSVRGRGAKRGGVSVTTRKYDSTSINTSTRGHGATRRGASGPTRILRGGNDINDDSNIESGGGASVPVRGGRTDGIINTTEERDYVEGSCQNKCCFHPFARNFVMCSECNDWVHSICAGIPYSKAQAEDFIYVCPPCKI
ncbi:PREDICTED: uncharacterized protein LOC109580511 [Amphimedon queenslandica]|uniref:PHD-type domain-containing protein n=1 Tax=Amphimedon queenslandica TaxID=400682 RepID=A0AAN0IX72_AMPQE|nr:PREDICTED: uncharacterized protein LOC109580511 [Amphimedon queenslandica]|eukprot:XP_019849360.1 PREDICTED: uncharacterized protein LOC109580511 [Amphimedon queenslandica]